MAYTNWFFKSDDGFHRVELEHGYWSGNRLIRVDGKVMEKSVKLFDTGGRYPFKVGDHQCEVCIHVPLWLYFRYELFVDGQKTAPIQQTEYEQQLPPVTIIETGRKEELIGDEERIIDNSRSSVEVTRKLSISKDWFQAYSVENEKINQFQGQAGLEYGKVANLKLSAESKIREQYSVSQEIRRTYSDELTVVVPKHVRLRIVLHWKRIWQTGFIKLLDSLKQEIEIPYKIAVGVTFDQTQVDES